jgi:hypothetical protein
MKVGILLLRMERMGGRVGGMEVLTSTDVTLH